VKTTPHVPPSSRYTLRYWLVALIVLEFGLGACALEVTAYYLLENTTRGQLVRIERRTRPIYERTRYGYFSFENTTVSFRYLYTVNLRVYVGHRVSNLVAYPTPSFLPGPVTVYFCPFFPAWSTLQGFDLVSYLENLLPLALNTLLLVALRKKGHTATERRTKAHDSKL
jgi:hypothetical protein